MRRRDFIKGIAGSAAAWPLAVHAQQSAVPVIGFLSARSPLESTRLVAAFLDGLKDGGFVSQQNVRIEYRWAEGQYDQLPGLASDLVNRGTAVIVAVGNTPSAFAARAATTVIPIVFVVGDDPVKIGLVESIARPRGNLTGVSLLLGQLGPKRLEILRQVVPDALTVGLLANQNNPTAEEAIKPAHSAAVTYGVQLIAQTASSDSELEAAFDNLVQQHVTAMAVDADPFFTTRRERLIALAIRYAISTVYPNSEFALSGGLISYGGDVRAGYRIAGGYVGRILKGTRPSDLPVQQSTKIELILNLKTAKALGLTFPLPLLGRADEVIE